MRKLVFQMMTTLNGRLDDPMAWLKSVSDDQYQAIDRIYATYDTVLVGRTTYAEMAAYWPGVLAEGQGTKINQIMAQRMHDYRKLVFSKSGRHTLAAWNNVEQVIAKNDEDLAGQITWLKEEPGRNIQLSGGASFAQSVIALGLVDEFHFFVYPAVSQGAAWFAQWPGGLDLELVNTNSYENGVVHLHYLPVRRESEARKDSFTELLT